MTKFRSILRITNLIRKVRSLSSSLFLLRKKEQEKKKERKKERKEREKGGEIDRSTEWNDSIKFSSNYELSIAVVSISSFVGCLRSLGFIESHRTIEPTYFMPMRVGLDLL